jgi:hypothetical protein
MKFYVLRLLNWLPNAVRQTNQPKHIKPFLLRITYSVEITYGINSVISKLMTFAENAETGEFLFLIMLILSYFTCS